MTTSASSMQLQDFSAAIAGLVATAAPAVVAVHSQRARSSGFFWHSNLIVTADEALAEDGDIAITVSGGKTVPAKLVGRDPTTDIALLRVDQADLSSVRLQATQVAVGSTAIVVGADEGAPTVAFGVVARSAGAWRSVRGGEIDARVELDVSLRARAEGGLALDAAGNAIGMAVFGPRRRVLVIPSATIERVAAKLESHGRIARGYLGLGLQSVAGETGADDGAGIMVMSVDPKGPAAAAGVHQGDVIVSWNGEPVRHVPPLVRALGPDSVGRTVKVEVRRASERAEISLTIGERPAT